MKSRKKTAAIIAIIFVLAVAGTLVLTACSSGPVGFWIVEKVTAGDVVMSEKDAESIGLSAIGTIKLQKSGNCVVSMLGEESEGSWEQAADGTLAITYGDNQTLSGSVDESGVMTLTDPQGAEYILKK